MALANQRTRLTNGIVARLLNCEEWSEVWDKDIRGFHIRKTSKSASYRLSYRHPVTRKPHVLTLGRADQIPFNVAKEAAAKTVSMFAIQALGHNIEAIHNQHC